MYINNTINNNNNDNSNCSKKNISRKYKKKPSQYLVLPSSARLCPRDLDITRETD
jgi:hypothetical protein